MASWIIFSVLALFAWGFYGFFPKLATNYIDPKSALIYEAVGAIIVGMAVLAFTGFKLQVHSKGSLFGILMGLCGTLGALFFIFALGTGKLSVVAIITALYPLVTIFLAFLILHEPITLIQGLGIFFALIALVLFSL